ncbi:MAG: peptidylprolyl isomerase [Leptolyngbya sp. SIO1E4]|nr:peptidylprolyl isomerase [Leptolyngbya sp. SIO1E4]
MSEASQPVITDTLNNILAVSDAEDVSINLSDHFDDPSTTGLVARFELFNTSLGGGVKEVLLFDQAETGAPLTVQNFLNYVNDGDYVNSIIHRSIPGSIVQGGGFTINDLANNLANPANALGIIPTDPPVPNEFSPDRSNVRGTIAMAKLENDPNSATNQWFFNLADNSGALDNQNGGFTVFGEVLSATDLAVIDAIAAVDIFNGTGLNPAFSDLPLVFNNPNNPVITGDENFVRYSSITVAQRDELEFTVSNNSNPQLLNVSINDNQLVLDYLPGQFGTADITVQATNLLGQVVEDTFSVTVGSGFLFGLAEDEVFFGAAGDDILAGGGGQDTLNGGDGNDQLFGNSGNDILRGGEGDDILVGGSMGDTLTGGAGSDVFRYFSLGESVLIDGEVGTMDVITDLVIGTDSIDSVSAVSAANVVQAGTTATLNEIDIQAVLSAASFVANGAATFTFDSRSFLALNDGLAGYQQGNDAVIEITGFSGNLANLEIT